MIRARREAEAGVAYLESRGQDSLSMVALYNDSRLQERSISYSGPTSAHCCGSASDGLRSEYLAHVKCTAGSKGTHVK